MRVLLVLLILWLPLSSLGQGRIGFDISSRFQGVNMTVNYHHLFKNKLLLSAGMHMGSNGYQFISVDSTFVDNGNTIRSPFESINKPYSDSTGSYPSLLAYETKARSWGVSLGVGTFKTLNDQNSIRGHIFGKVGTGFSDVRGYYRSAILGSNATRRTQNAYLIASISLEAFHVVRMTNRLAFYWGVKVPYFFQVNPSQYSSENQRDLHFGFEPELSAGLTLYVGKSPEKDEDLK